MDKESDTEKPELDIKELEKEKIRLEIKELDKSWWKKTKYLQVALPSFIALGSVLYAFQSDLISVQREKNELKEMQLKNSIAKFETQKTILLDTLAYLKNNRDSLDVEIKNMQEYYDTEIMIKAVQSGHFIDDLEEKDESIRILENNWEKLIFNLKIIKNAPFLNQSTIKALKVWEEKQMNEYSDSLFITMQGSHFGTKKSIRKMKRKDSVLKEYSKIQPKSN